MAKETEDRAAQIAAREAELAARETAFAERERQASRKDAESFCEGLVKDGRLPPGLAPSAVAIMGALAGAGTAGAAQLGQKAREYQAAQAKEGRKVDIGQAVRHLAGA